MSMTVRCPRCGKGGVASGASRKVRCPSCGARFRAGSAAGTDAGPAAERLRRREEEAVAKALGALKAGAAILGGLVGLWLLWWFMSPGHR